METWTPRGMKIRIPVDSSFTLMGRLKIKSAAKRVLFLTECIETFRPLVTAIMAVLVIYLRIDPLVAAALVACTNFIAKLISIFGLYFFPITAILFLTRLLMFCWGFGIITVGLIVYAWMSGGIELVSWIFGGWLVALLVGQIAEVMWSRRVERRSGLILTESERNFMSAYLCLAKKHGASLDPYVSESERVPQNWLPCFEEFYRDCPEAVNKFYPEARDYNFKY